MIALNVVPMIDVFAIIIIFLIKGTVMGVSSIEVPSDIELPKSKSLEGIEQAPSIVIGRDYVSFSLSKSKVPLNDFFSQNNSNQQKRLKEEMNSYIQNIPKKVKASGVLLNVITDSSTPYKTVFEVVRFFRAAGFQSLLFVAKGSD